MLVEGQIAKVKITKSNKDYFKNLGYDVSSNLLNIKAEHLRRSSAVELEFQCDECGDIHTKQWKSHFDKLTKQPKPDLCQKCRVSKASKSYNQIITVFGKTKRECFNKIVSEEKRGYECLFPMQKREGIIDKHEGNMRVFYFTKMKQVKNF